MKDQWKEILETAFYDSNPDAPCGERYPFYQDIEKCVAILLEKVRQETRKEIIEMIPPQDELAGWGDDTDYAKGYRDGYRQANSEFKHRLQAISAISNKE